MQSNVLGGKKQPCRYTGMGFRLLLLLGIRKVFESHHGQALYTGQFSTSVLSSGRVSVIWRENENKPENCINNVTSLQVEYCMPF